MINEYYLVNEGVMRWRSQALVVGPGQEGEDTENFEGQGRWRRRMSRKGWMMSIDAPQGMHGQ
eukprot:10691925-Heterocapsa_arctica.AAC.1